MATTGTLVYPPASNTPGRGIPTPAHHAQTRAAGRGSLRRAARAVVGILALAYLGLVAFITLAPAGRGDAVSELSGQALGFLGRLPLPAGFTAADAEFALNVLMFAPFGIFAVLLFGGRGFWLAALTGIALSVGIEWIQEFIPSRVSDPRDLLANGAGAIIGAILALPFARLLRPRRR